MRSVEKSLRKRKRERKKYGWQVEDFVRNVIAREEVDELFRKVVAIVRQKVVRFAGKTIAVFFDEPENDFLGEFCISHRNDLYWMHSKIRLHLH